MRVHVLLGCLLPALLLSCGRRGGEFEGSSLVLVSLGSLRADRLSCYGSGRRTSPTLDGLAFRGCLFEHARAQSTRALSSCVSILTSLCPSGHGVRTEGDTLPAKVPTLASVLHGHGYRTAAFVEGAGAASPSDSRYGFELYRSLPSGGKGVREALRWADEHAGEPFFLFLSLGPEAGAEGEEGVLRGDRDLGIFLDGLEGTGVLRKCLLAVTASRGEKPLARAVSLREGVLRVPLIIALPGWKRPRSIDTPVALVDIVPTLLDLLGISPPKGMEGKSLREAVLRGKEPAPRPVFAEDEDRVCVMEGGWKLILPRGKGEGELYDLEEDPEERVNLFSLREERVRALRRTLEKWEKECLTRGRPGGIRFER